jgi:hypothetical protein
MDKTESTGRSMLIAIEAPLYDVPCQETISNLVVRRGVCPPFCPDMVVGRGRPSLLDRPIGPASAVLFEIDIDRILFAATLDQPLLLPVSGAGRA